MELASPLFSSSSCWLVERGELCPAEPAFLVILILPDGSPICVLSLSLFLLPEQYAVYVAFWMYGLIWVQLSSQMILPKRHIPYDIIA